MGNIKNYTLGKRYVVKLSDVAVKKFNQKRVLLTLITIDDNRYNCYHLYAEDAYFEGYVGKVFYELISNNPNRLRREYFPLFATMRKARFYDVIYFNFRDIYIPSIKKLFTNDKTRI